MKKAKKILTLVACAVLLVALSVGATIAYLTSSDDVVNTFTVGKVKITLDEAPVDEYGEVIEGDRRQANEYKLMPGHTYTKDPTVKVVADSEESYIRMLVTLNEYDDLLAIFEADNVPDGEEYVKVINGQKVLLLEKLVSGWDSNIWNSYKAERNETTNSITYEFRYYTTVETVGDTEDTTLEALFTEITLPDWVTNEQVATLGAEDAVEENPDTPETEKKDAEPQLQIDIVAQAIQKDSFDTADEAWAEW